MSQDDPTQGVHAGHDRSMCLRRIYSGTHTSHVAVRFQDFVIPFFGRTLVFR